MKLSAKRFRIITCSINQTTLIIVPTMGRVSCRTVSTGRSNSTDICRPACMTVTMGYNREKEDRSEEQLDDMEEATIDVNNQTNDIIYVQVARKP